MENKEKTRFIKLSEDKEERKNALIDIEENIGVIIELIGNVAEVKPYKKKNEFGEARKSNAGRPMKFENVEELEKAVDGYFASCYEEQWFEEYRRDEETGEWLTEEYFDDKEQKTKTRKQTFLVKRPVQIKPFMITGLALFLNTTRETLMDYENNDEFSDTIKKAKQMIEGAYEERLIRRGNAGDIFALKNFKWKDESTVNANTNVEDINDIKKEIENLKQKANDDFADSEQPEEASEDGKTEITGADTEPD